MSEHVRTELRGRIAVVTIDRQKALNALTSQVLVELEEVITNLEASDAVRAIVITGAGEKAFVAGADIKEMSDFDVDAGTAHARRGQAVFDQISSCSKPVIAAIGGFALGGGMELAMSCHIRYASPAARFGQPEVKLGLIPGFGGTQRLPRLVGRGRALEILLDGGKMIGAEEAHAIGLVNAVVPAAELLDSCVALGERIAAMGPQACQWVIQAVESGLEESQAQGLDREATLFGKCFGTADGKEGMTAFLERRAAEFKGR